MTPSQLSIFHAQYVKPERNTRKDPNKYRNQNSQQSDRARTN